MISLQAEKSDVLLGEEEAFQDQIIRIILDQSLAHGPMSFKQP